jgi:hypothetical protein
MIEWAIANTNDVLTSSASTVESFSISGTNFFPTSADDTYTVTGARTTWTSVDSAGTTITASSTRKRDANARDFITNYDTSGSGETITPATFYVQTSTTETYSSFYTTYTTTTFSADGDEIGFVPFWTTSSAEDGAVSFYEGDGTLASFAQEQITSRQATRDITTQLTETAAGRFPFATVYQAETRDATAELLYWISDPLISWSGYAPASDAATSGTRFTAHPSYATAQKIVVAGGATTTASASAPEITTLVDWGSTTQNTGQKTRAIAWFVLPNLTQTFAQSTRTTTTAELSSTLFAETEWTVGHGGNAEQSNTTRSAVTWNTYPTTVLRQFGQQTFATTALTGLSAETTVLTTAIATKATSYSIGVVVGLAAFGTEGQTYEAAGNEVIHNSGKITTNVEPGGISRSAFSTTGAVLGSEVSGWMSIDTSEPVTLFDPPFDFATAYDGANVGGRTLRPATNVYLTINSDSLTWTISTNTTGGETTQTTTSTVVQLAGESLTTEIATTGRPFHAGGLPLGPGATYVDTPRRGAYKDRIGGTTTSFVGAATALTEGESAPIYSWVPITYIDFPVAATNANPIVWAVPRNSTALPPA